MILPVATVQIGTTWGVGRKTSLKANNLCIQTALHSNEQGHGPWRLSFKRDVTTATSREGTQPHSISLGKAVLSSSALSPSQRQGEVGQSDPSFLSQALEKVRRETFLWALYFIFRLLLWSQLTRLLGDRQIPFANVDRIQF